ncbi:MAG: hypothetical protein RLZZ15_2655 [Verrucomicrobiota bacterium]|jgi:glucose/arabinose dehydrogenase/mono/diheme cytochrome c family protein
MSAPRLRASRRRVSVALLVFAAAVRAFAQLGDKKNDEPQRPPNAELALPPAKVFSPEEARRAFVLPPGFRIELVAAEPLVRDPVMMTFDARGRLWVAELSAYNAEVITELPVYLEKGKAPPTRPLGRVVILEDTDGDGVMDRRTVYADNLDVPRAIAFAGDEVLIGDPPNLWRTRDTNGDGVMDEKTLLADDYGTPENVEGSANGLLWARDNWLYNAAYRARWRKISGAWQREPTVAQGQWGLTQDDFGRMFFNSNSDQLRGDFLPSRYLAGLDRRLPLHGANFQVAADQSTWPIHPTPGVNRGYKTGQLREDGTLATFTAASAPLIYRGTNFPAEFSGNAFVPEPGGNLVKRNLLVEAAGRLTALNAYQGVEFLASPDERFRPVFLTNAPDGALYVVDYYRGMLEGYQFATTYLRDQILARGLNAPLWGHGRIWRIVHENGAPAKLPDFARADAAALVKLLADDNGWVRDTAQRLLVERAPAAAASLLRAVLATAPLARDRVGALWSLEGTGALTPDDLARAAADADARVRVAAAQAAEPLLRTPAGAGLVALWRGRVAREEPSVLAQIALSVSVNAGGGTSGVAESETAKLDLLWSLLPRASEHASLADALLIALRGRETEVLRRLRAEIAARPAPPFGAAPLLESLAIHLVRAGGPAADALANAIGDAPFPQWGRYALMRGATKVAGASLPEKNLAALAAGAPDPSVRQKAATAVEALRQRRARQAARPVVAPLTTEQLALFEAGRTTYGLCAACHQPDGLGKVAVAPSLKEGRWANAVSADSAIRILLKGKEGTPGFPAAMVPLATLPDEQLAGVLTFVRRSFGNNASAVAPADIARVRLEVVSRVNAWTDAELEKLDPASK